MRTDVLVYALWDNGAIDSSADPERKLQLTVFQCGSGQPGNGVSEEALFRCNLRQPAVVQLVGAGHAHTPRAIHVDAVAVNVDHPARNPLVGQFQIGGNYIKGGRVILGWSKIVEVRQL